MTLKKFPYFVIKFVKNEDGMIEKSFEGYVKPEEYFNIESGIATVLAHIYNCMSHPEDISDGEADDDSLFKITFLRDAMGQFQVYTMGGELDKNDCENIITGLSGMGVQMHLERMSAKNIKVTMVDDGKLSAVSFKTDEQLV